MADPRLRLVPSTLSTATSKSAKMAEEGIANRYQVLEELGREFEPAILRACFLGVFWEAVG